MTVTRGAVAFMSWAQEHVAAQPGELQARLLPRLRDLERAAGGEAPEQPFLGWTTGKHWLLG